MYVQTCLHEALQHRKGNHHQQPHYQNSKVASCPYRANFWIKLRKKTSDWQRVPKCQAITNGKGFKVFSSFAKIPPSYNCIDANDVSELVSQSKTRIIFFYLQYKKSVTIYHRWKKAFGHHSLYRQHSHHPPHVTSNFYFNKANQEMDVVVSKDASKEKTLEHEELLEHIRSFHSSKLPFI